MPVKKSKPRCSTTLRRTTKYAETYRSKTVPLWFKKTLPEGANLLEEWLINQEELEKQIYAELQADGVASELWPYYAALGRRCFVKCLNFSSDTYSKERTSLRNEFILRGLDSYEVDETINIADYKCGLVKGILVKRKHIEDFRTYTEVDVAADHVQVAAANHVDHKAYRNEDTYLYKDFGANYFGNFTHRVDVKTDFAQDISVGYVWALSRLVDDMFGIYDANNNDSMSISVLFYRFDGGVHKKNLWLREAKAKKGGFNQVASVELTENTWYYLLIKKVGKSLKCGIYSTASLRDVGNAADGDVSNLSLTLAADYTLRYIFACNTQNEASKPYLNNDVENLILQDC